MIDIQDMPTLLKSSFLQAAAHMKKQWLSILVLAVLIAYFLRDKLGKWYQEWSWDGIAMSVWNLVSHVAFVVLLIFFFQGIVNLIHITNAKKLKQQIQMQEPEVRPEIIDSEADWQDIISSIVDTLHSPRDLNQKAIFLDGMWGSGKTTFLQYFKSLFYTKKHGTTNYKSGFSEKDLANLPQHLTNSFQQIDIANWEIIDFNPWQLHKSNDPVSTFIDVFKQNPVCKELLLGSLLDRFLNSIRSTDNIWLMLILILEQSSIDDIIRELKERLGQKKFLVVVDDLERCPPSFIEQIIRLISLLRPAHDNIRFLVTGHAITIENQLSEQLKLPYQNNTVQETPMFIEKLFQIIYLPYSNELIARYILDFKSHPLANDKSLRQRSTQAENILNECIIPYLKAFGPLNRRECQNVCKYMFKNYEGLIETATAIADLSTKNPSQSEQEFANQKEKAILHLEKLLTSLMLILIKNRDLIMDIESDLSKLAILVGQASTEPNEKQLADNDGIIWSKLNKEKGMFLAKELHKLADNSILGPIDGNGTIACTESRLKEVIKTFKSLSNHVA